MKNKGLNFMEAVRAMKEGKKVRRPDYLEDVWFNIKDYKIKDNNGKIMLCETGKLEATDWEVVEDDKDWSLINNPFDKGDWEWRYKQSVVVKCRDLILEDFSSYGEPLRGDISRVINKRFGDLK